MTGNRESKERCVFCKILAGDLPVSQIYRDHEVAVFADIQPVNTGHVLVIPIAHSTYLEDLDPSIAGTMFQVAQKVAQAIRQSGVACEGINVFLADGEAAGQEVWHTHLHVFPRFAGDGFGLDFSDQYFVLPEREELNRVATQIKREFDSL